MNGGIFGHLVGLFRSVAVVALARDDHETMTTNCAPRLILTRYPRHFASKKKQRGTAEGKVHYVTIWRGEEEDVQLCTRTRTRNHNLRLLPPKG